jgi:hypothetical protein
MSIALLYENHKLLGCLKSSFTKYKVTSILYVSALAVHFQGWISIYTKLLEVHSDSKLQIIYIYSVNNCVCV